MPTDIRGYWLGKMEIKVYHTTMDVKDPVGVGPPLAIGPAYTILRTIWFSLIISSQAEYISSQAKYSSKNLLTISGEVGSFFDYAGFFPITGFFVSGSGDFNVFLTFLNLRGIKYASFVGHLYNDYTIAGDWAGTRELDYEKYSNFFGKMRMRRIPQDIFERVVARQLP
jgi:hypothetical protein